MAQGGIGLLSRTADEAEDPQTLRMVAGAIANLCGNGIYMLLISFQYILNFVFCYLGFLFLTNLYSELTQCTMYDKYDKRL